MLRGRCFCGAVQYEARNEVCNETFCHCSVCRRVSGASPVAWLTVPAASFRFTAGQPTKFQSSSHASRSFCGCCGTPLTFQSTTAPDEVDITICSLEHPEQVPPRDHIHTASKIPWVSVNDGLPVYEESRSN